MVPWIGCIVLGKGVVLVGGHARCSGGRRSCGLGGVEGVGMGPEVELWMMVRGRQVLVVLEVLFVGHCAECASVVWALCAELFTESSQG